ncbi:MAG: MarR family winged helix-turn-helix transcriptional regulator [Usitatibacter sp.]
MNPLRNFGFLLKDVSRLSALNFQRHATELNVTMAQCKVLAYLQRNEGISQVRLAELTDTGPMTLARTLERMEGEGWIERRIDPADGRARQLFLRPPAAPLLREMWRVADRARADAMAGLNAADRARLMSLLERIHSNLATLIPDAKA